LPEVVVITYTHIPVLSKGCVHITVLLCVHSSATEGCCHDAYPVIFRVCATMSVRAGIYVPVREVVTLSSVRNV